MISTANEWVVPWVCDKLICHEEICNATPIDDFLIKMNVKRCAQEILVVAISKQKCFLTDIPHTYQSSKFDFLLNVPKNAYFDGALLSYAERKPFGIGGLGDLYSAACGKEFREYLPQETKFILRGLRQHTAVFSVNRDNNRLYEVERVGGKSSLKILALNDYELTADAIRSGIDLYGKCDFVLASNPNCGLSSQGKNAAVFCGVKVLKWKQLLGAINSA